MEDQVENLEEAQKIIKSLRERYRAQSHQLLAMRWRVKTQVHCSPINYKYNSFIERLQVFMAGGTVQMSLLGFDIVYICEFTPKFWRSHPL
jgi:hypothetical protein